jgi:uncharacterized protein (UPF0276 family)
MTTLTASFSDNLDALLQAGRASVDGLEFGPWYSLERTRGYLSHLKGWNFYFHPAGLISHIGLVPGANKRLRSYLAMTRSPWASFHLVLEPAGCFWMAVRMGIFLPQISPEWMTRAFIQKIRTLSRQLAVPILLENLPSFPDPRWRYGFQAEPERIRRVLESTGAGLLLDLGHARVAAEWLSLAVEDYLDRSPLERVRQLHVSGPRLKNGHLHDMHQPMLEVDYRLLDWTLAHTRPQVVTLEFIQEEEPLREQLERLKAMINSGRSS